MRAREFVREDADGQQVLDYIHGTHHEPLTKQLQQAVLSYPRWELRSVPVSSLHIPDQEYDDEEQEPETDPYNRVQAIDPDHAGEYSANFVDRRPIVVDADGWIIDGNHRAWAAAELLNRSTIRAWVPVKQGVAENFADGQNPQDKDTELKNSIPTGLYFDIDDVSVSRSYQGLGIGALLYKLVITCIARLNPKVKGLLSPRKNRLSTAANVSKIYSQLGGKININGAKDTYDLLPIKNYITLEVEPQPGAQIAAISGKNISFLVDEAGPYRVVLTVFDHNTMKPIGFISATASFWDSETETLDNENISENFADGRNPQDKGDSKRYGVPTKASVSTLRKVAKQGGRKGQLAHWMANMKAGRAKAKKK
jgi:hypothetical protein